MRDARGRCSGTVTAGGIDGVADHGKRGSKALPCLIKEFHPFSREMQYWEGSSIGV